VSYWPLSFIDDINGVRVGGSGRWMGRWKRRGKWQEFDGRGRRIEKGGKEDIW